MIKLFRARIFAEEIIDDTPSGKTFIKDEDARPGKDPAAFIIGCSK